MVTIKQLSDITINQIAAGEVIEKPASVVKELVENSIDAGATEIYVEIERGGKNYILVKDNGYGMSAENLAIAILRHTTSKLDESNIMDIASYGFRGEALASISSVSRMKITSIEQGQTNAYSITSEGGNNSKVSLDKLEQGTEIEIRDLFYATPARLKFLKADKTEALACLDVIKKLALSSPNVKFTFVSDGSTKLSTKSIGNLESRIEDILGKDFIQNSVKIDFAREGIRIHGFASLPTYNKSSNLEQYLFINNRPVKDKLLIAAVKVAYMDYLAIGRNAVIALYIDIDTELVDVNVHPTKSEVRFHDPNLIRGLTISSIKEALQQQAAHRASTTIAQQALNYAKPQNMSMAVSNKNYYTPSHGVASNLYKNSQGSFAAEKPNLSYQHTSFTDKPFITTAPYVKASSNMNMPEEILDNIQENIKQQPEAFYEEHPLGAACVQVHNTYIISQTKDGIVIIDQHAAHERLVYEDLKESLSKQGVKSQRLLIPEIIELPSEEHLDLMLENIAKLSNMGFIFEKFNEKSVLVREVPSMLGQFDVIKLTEDIANELFELGENVSLTEMIEHVTETFACHGSIRAGRSMNIVEMNALLRKMEQTAFSGQCNHGRPTYVKLELKDIEKLFGRR